MCHRLCGGWYRCGIAGVPTIQLSVPRLNVIDVMSQLLCIFIITPSPRPSATLFGQQRPPPPTAFNNKLRERRDKEEARGNTVASEFCFLFIVTKMLQFTAHRHHISRPGVPKEY